jgi:hypothetical protein
MEFINRETDVNTWGYYEVTIKNVVFWDVTSCGFC